MDKQDKPSERVRQSENSRKLDIHNPYIVGTFFFVLSISYTNIVTWGLFGVSKLTYASGNMALSFLKTNVVLDRAESNRFLFFLCLILFGYIFDNWHKYLRLPKNRVYDIVINSIIMIAGFFVTFFLASHDIARNKYGDFKRGVVCQKMSYEKYREYQKEIYLTDNFLDAVEKIDSKLCK